MTSDCLISARWIQDFEKQLYRRRHLILYGINHIFIEKGNPCCVRLSDCLFPNSQPFSQLLMAKDAIFDLMDGA